MGMKRLAMLVFTHAMISAMDNSPYSRYRETRDNEMKWTPPKYKEKVGVVKPIPDWKFKKKLSKKQRKKLNK